MMLYFVMARYRDARPLIDYYSLKKDMAGCPFTIFIADNVVLCLSDGGRANTAAATAYLLTRWGRDGLFVHIVPSKTGEEVLYPHTILDGENKVYQEMLYKPPPFIREDTLEDGEGVYAFLSASRFLPLKQIIVLQTNNPVNEGILSWLETICTAHHPFGTIPFPTSMWKKAQATTQQLKLCLPAFMIAQ